MRGDEVEAHWATIGERILYSGRTLLLERDVVLPGGDTLAYEVDESIPFAVACLIVADGRVLLARQYRYPVDRWIYDLPGGAGHVGEEPLSAARREAEEELGVVPEDLIRLHTFFSNPGRNAWPIHVFTGSVISSGTADADDPAERVRAVFVPVAELDELIRSGEIVDPTLLIARAMAGAVGILPLLAPAGRLP